MQFWKTLQPGRIYRTSEQLAEEARYHQECAESAARRRQSVEQGGDPSHPELSDAELTAQQEKWGQEYEEYERELGAE